MILLRHEFSEDSSMNTMPMTNLHQTAAPWLWYLAQSQAATLAPQDVPRWLHVEDGCVWVTAQNSGPHAPDLWLGAGDSLELPAGSTWVLQAWPQARMSLMAPRPAPDRASQPAPRAWWQSAWFWPWVLPSAHRTDGPHMA